MHDPVEEEIAIGSLRLRLRRPRRPEDLIDEHTFAEDEFLPYWAELWPSALALATVLERAPLAGERVLELGCGLGLPSLVAAARGAEVTATDWSPDAVRAVADNAALNNLDLHAHIQRWPAVRKKGQSPQSHAERASPLAEATRFAEVRKMGQSPESHAGRGSPLAEPIRPAEMRKRGLSPESHFRLVVGSDLLYEARNGPWLLAALERWVAPQGEAWIADPGRATAEDFFVAAPERFDVDVLEHDGPAAVTVHRLRRR